MPALSRPWLLGLTTGCFLAAALFAITGPRLPALAQSGRAIASAPPEIFQTTGTMAAPQDTPAGPLFLDPPVPAGKVFVVEAVYVSLQVSSGEPTLVEFGPVGDALVTLPIARQTIFGGNDFYAAASPGTRLYLPAGPVQANFSKRTEAFLNGRITAIGHLVQAP